MDQGTEKQISWLGARLREKSTYAGLVVLLGLVFPHLTNAGAIAEVVCDFGVAFGALIAVLVPENGSPK